MGRKDERNWRDRGQWGSSNGGPTSGKNKALAWLTIGIWAGPTLAVAAAIGYLIHSHLNG